MNKKNEKFPRLACEHCEYIFVAPYPEDSTCPRCKKFSRICRSLLIYENSKDLEVKLNKILKEVAYYQPGSNWPSPYGSSIGPPSTWSFPTKNVTCPKCGSANIKKYIFNTYKCIECRYEF